MTSGQRPASRSRAYLRRTLQIAAFVGTLVVGVIALALIASQTPWFRDWLRRFVVREAGSYVNGTVSIGSLGGNVFYGIELGDVAIDVNGEHVVTLEHVEIKYSLAELVSTGMTVRRIVVQRPYALLRHDAAGWNVASLVKRQQQEADRQGPGRPLSLPDIEIVDGRLAIDDRAPSPLYRLPSRIDGLNAKGGFAYEPVHYSVTLDRVGFNGHAPDLTVTALSGRVGTRDDDLHVETLFLQTAQSSATIDGVVRNYLATPSLQVSLSAPRVSVPELAGVLPPVKGYDLHGKLDLKATGPDNDLQLAVNVASEAGAIHGTLRGDAQAPDFALRGDVSAEHLDLAPLLQDPSRTSDITGAAKLDVRLASNPASAPLIDRVRGTVTFDGPRVVAEGYTTTGVHLSAQAQGRRVNLDARANAYGGRASVKGAVTVPSATGEPLAFDVTGQASHVDLAGLPRATGAPRVRTDLNVEAFHAQGSAGKSTNVEGSATWGRSTVADGTIVGGTQTEVSVAFGPGKAGLQSATYAARGEVRDVNLRRVGQAFQIAALDSPEYDSRINTTFDLKGSGIALDRMRLDGTATAVDSHIYGGTVPRLVVEAHLANGAVNGRATGELRGFDPARIAKDPQYKGEVNGAVDAAFGIANIHAPMTADAITADGRLTIAPSEVAGFRIDSADIEGQYANRRGVLRRATVKASDLDVTASGPIVLDESGQTNVKYHVAASDLAALGKLAGQPDLSGSAILDGAITGNGSSLRIAGALDGSNVGYQDDKALDLNSHYTVTVPDLQFTRAAVQAQTTGSFIQAAGLQINTLTLATTYANQTLDFQTHLAAGPDGGPTNQPRELDASGSVVFHPDHQEIHLPSLALRTQGVEWKTAPGSQTAIEYGANRVTVNDLHLVNGDQSLAASGSFALGSNPQIGGLTVEAKNVDLAQLEKLAMQDRGFTGRLNANATLSGNAKAPDVKGHVDVQNGGFQQFTYQSLAADGSFVNDRIAIDARLVQAPGVELTAAGTAPMSALTAKAAPGDEHVTPAPGQGIDLHVQSTRIDLGIVQGFTRQITNVTGTVQADVQVTGTAADPHLNGFVDFQNGAFSIPQAGTRFTGMTTRIELQPDRVRVPRFQILDQHGKALTIEGELAVHELQGGAVDVAIDADDFKLFDNELGNVHLETHLKLTGELRRPRIEGEVHADAARLEIDRILLLTASPYSEQALPDVVSAEDTETSSMGADQATRAALEKGRAIAAAAAPGQNATAPATPPPAGLFSALALDVHLVAPDNLVMRGDDLHPGGPSTMAVGSLNATVGADVQIVKKIDGPITIRGTADTVRGFYEFQGRRFTLQRGGTAQFTGGADINPLLNVTAERLIPNTGVTARIHVTGTPRAPKLTLTSDPPLDEADILSLIVFNRNINDLGSGEKASLAETAGGIASGFVAQSLGKSIGKALDVDLFEITTTDPETGESAGGVTLGKQVSDRAFVQFRQQFGNRSFTEFMLEYQLAKFLRLDLQTAPQSSGVANRLTQRRVERAGVDLIFFFSY
ncbi:MAG TPA: translocation/assembly module TamB domain-containing protein [Vicinamibacterales bacterium]